MIGIIGCDVGQARDPAALVVLLPAHDAPHDPPGWGVAETRRLPLGTSYQDIVTTLHSELSQLAALELHPVAAVDATGVGRVIVELARGHGADVLGITATGGHRLGPSRNTARGAGRGPRDITVPQAGLIGVLTAALESGRLTLTAEAAPLREELTALMQRGRRIEARRGHHDDLAYACAIGLTAGDLLTRPEQTRHTIATHARRYARV